MGHDHQHNHHDDNNRIGDRIGDGKPLPPPRQSARPPTTPPAQTKSAVDTEARAVGRARTTEDWEQVRRSVAMLPTGSWALKREQALEALSSLIISMRR